MRFEDWQTVQRLLIGCPNGEGFDRAEADWAFDQAIQTLQHHLPTAEIALLSVVSPSSIPSSPISYQAITPLHVLYQLQFITSDAKALHSSTTRHSAPQTFLSLQSTTEALRQYCFDVAILFTAPFHSPYTTAYLCYLAGIPLRFGQSDEFGGGVLSDWTSPPSSSICLADHYLHLLNAIGLSSPPTLTLNPNSKSKT